MLSNKFPSVKAEVLFSLASVFFFFGAFLEFGLEATRPFDTISYLLSIIFGCWYMIEDTISTKGF